MISCVSKEGMEETNTDYEVNVIPEKDLLSLIDGKDFAGVQFVDIRTPHEFAKGHISEAINVPMDNFFTERRFDSITKDKMVLLYGADSSTPKMMSILSSHFNKGEFYVISGGYEYIKQKYIDQKKEVSLAFDDEVAIVDFQQAIDNIKIKAGGEVSAKPIKKVKKKPVIKRKKKAVSGGCG